jgi:hypothetical protein
LTRGSCFASSATVLIDDITHNLDLSFFAGRWARVTIGSGT